MMLRLQRRNWHPRWNRTATPVLDSIVRWITRRTVGIALGAGAARGFAHIGVLSSARISWGTDRLFEWVEHWWHYRAAVFQDRVSGWCVRACPHLSCSNQLIRDPTIFPRSSLFRGLKVRRSSERMGVASTLLPSPGRYLSSQRIH